MTTTTLQLTGTLALPGEEVGELAVAGDGAVVVVRGGHLHVVDLDDGGAPRLRARMPLDVGPGIGRIATDGARVLVGQAGTVTVFDLPGAPGGPVRGAAFTSARVYGVALRGELALVSDGDSLACWRIGGGGAAARLGVLELDLAGRITLAGELAYVAADFGGMVIVDVRDPARPRELGRFTGPGDVCAVAVAGKVAYVADYTGGVSIVDVGDPRRPRALGEWDEGMVGEVAVGEGGSLYVAMGTLTEVDASTPRRPLTRATHTLEPDVDTAWSVATDGAGRVVALGERGLSVWRPGDADQNRAS